MTTEKPQIDKFKEAAREFERNEDEAAFDLGFGEGSEATPLPKGDFPERDGNENEQDDD